MDARTPDMIWEECLVRCDFAEWVNFIALHGVPVYRRQAPVRAERRPIGKNRRPRDSVKDPRNSYWFREYADPNPEHLAELLDPDTTRAKIFRRRFRLPYVVYQEILRKKNTCRRLLPEICHSHQKRPKRHNRCTNTYAATYTSPDQTYIPNTEVATTGVRFIRTKIILFFLHWSCKNLTGRYQTATQGCNAHLKSLSVLFSNG